MVIPNRGAVSVVPNWALGVLGRVSGGVNVPVTKADCAAGAGLGGVWGVGWDVAGGSGTVVVDGSAAGSGAAGGGEGVRGGSRVGV